MTDYLKMLKRARAQLPETVFQKSRFEIPKITGMHEGKKTIVTNFGKVCDKIRRDQKDVLKFLSRELASPAQLAGGRATFTGKFSSDQINNKIKKYVDQYVVCKECQKPDTKLIKENRITFLKCMACGAKHSVR